MHPALVGSAYGVSLVLALGLLYFFYARWYWHALSLAAALALGLIPIPQEWGIPDLLLGSVFFFLFIWGLGAPLFPPHRHHRTRHA